MSGGGGGWGGGEGGWTGGGRSERGRVWGGDGRGRGGRWWGGMEGERVVGGGGGGGGEGELGGGGGGAGREHVGENTAVILPDILCITMQAASGSKYALNSAADVTLPVYKHREEVAVVIRSVHHE